MKKKIAIVAAVVGGLIAAFLSYVSSLPDHVRVVRSMAISATAETIFPHINDVHTSRSWSPWNQLDPNMKLTYSGPSSGVGASYSWEGNEKVGAGRSTIIESDPNKRVKMKLEFFKPFEGVSESEIVLAPQGEATSVQWSMDSDRKFMEKLFLTILNMDMDKMIGSDFESGLKMLKAEVEKKNDTRITSGVEEKKSTKHE